MLPKYPVSQEIVSTPQRHAWGRLFSVGRKRKSTCFLYAFSPPNSITFDAHWPGKTPSTYFFITYPGFLSFIKNSSRTETSACTWVYYRTSTAQTIITEYQIISSTPKYRNVAIKRGKGTVCVRSQIFRQFHCKWLYFIWGWDLITPIRSFTSY